MSEKYNQNSLESKVDLKAIISSILKHKVVIVVITILVTIASFAYSYSTKYTTYTTQMDIVVNVPSFVLTEYESFPLNIKNNKQFMELIKSNSVILDVKEKLTLEESISSIRSRISYSTTTSTNDDTVFVVNVTGSNSDNSYELALALYESFYNYVDVYTKESAITYFINNYDIELRNATTELSSTNSKLERLIQLEESNQSQSETVINEIARDINSLKLEINMQEYKIARYETYLEQLNIDRENVNAYYETGDTTILENSSVSVIEPYIQRLSQPVPPQAVVHDSTLRNTMVGVIAGLLMGVMLALFIEYWNESDNLN